MKQFWDDIIAYLTENLNNASDIEKQVKVDYANNNDNIDYIVYYQ